MLSGVIAKNSTGSIEISKVYCNSAKGSTTARRNKSIIIHCTIQEIKQHMMQYIRINRHLILP